MAYDKNSRIGEFVANQGNQSLDQFDYYKQNLTQIPLGEERMYLVDMLDMDQFGHNASQLRKSLSITDSYQCDTDTEYGTIRIDTNYSFSQVTPEPTVDAIQDVMSGYCTYSQYIDYAPTESLFKDLYVKSTGKAIVYPHPVYRLDRISGVQLISENNTIYGSLDDINFKQGESASIIVNNELKHDVASYRRGTWNRLEYKIENKSLTHDFYVTTITIQPDSITLTKVPKQSSLSVLLFDTGGYDVHAINILCSWRLPSDPITSGQDIFNGNYFTMIFNKGYQGGNNGGDLNYAEFGFKKDMFSGSQMFVDEIDFTFVIGSRTDDNDDPDGGGDNQEYALSLRSTVGNSSKFVAVRKIAGNVFDNYRWYIFRGKYLDANKSEKLTINRLKILGNEQCISVATIDGETEMFVVARNECSAIKEFISMIETSNNISIGLVIRSGNTKSIAVKLNNNGLVNYYTASDDIAPTLSIEIKDISIVELSFNSVSFVVKRDYNGSSKTMYYSFRQKKNNDSILLGIYDSADYIFNAHDINKISNPYCIYNVNSSGKKIVGTRIVSTDSNIYKEVSYGFKTSFSNDRGLYVLTYESMLDNTLAIDNDIIQYVTDLVSINFSFGVGLSIDRVGYNSPAPLDIIKVSFSDYCMVILDRSTYDSDTGMPKVLPLKLIDEYPEIYYSSMVGEKAISLGKSYLVSKGGVLTESSQFRLMMNPQRILLSEDGIIFYDSGYLFLSKSSLTNVYVFSEFGLQLQVVLEDSILCNPIKISIGIIAVGKRGIWLISSEARLLWASPKEIIKASIKTDLDNSCIVTIYIGDSVKFYVYGNTAGSLIKGISGSSLATESPSFTIIGINQFGHISSINVPSNMKSINFIDASKTSRLLIFDSVTSNINYITKSSLLPEHRASISSNQNVEYYGNTVYADVVKVIIFVKGTGTATLFVNGVGQPSINVSSTKYVRKEWYINYPYDMLYYRLELSSGVVMLQRVFGLLVRKEYHG